MKNKTLILIMALACTSINSYAANQSENVIVYANPDKIGSRTIGDQVYYSKTFNVMLFNATNKAVDLSKGCFQLVSKKDVKAELDTIHEKLITGKLSPNSNVKGFVEFLSENDSIYDAKAVKFKKSCDSSK